MFKIKKVIRLPLLSILLLLSIGSYAQSEIITSSNDDKKYDSLTLDNGLSVLVISDPNADVAAASLTLSAGSKESPKHRLGLAHLLEHIVLLASQNHPEIGGFNQFFKQQNGWSNGSTRTDNTRYHFQLNESALDEGLNRLADAIHAPLFNKKIIQTAMTAVQSEYQGKISNDWRGTLEVIRLQLNPEHPASKFKAGSLATLQPKLGDFKGDIKDFHKQYYVAKNMKLVLYAKQSIEQLKKRAIKHFSHISSQGKLVKASKGPLRLKPQLATQTSVKIRNETSSLDVLFEVPAPIADLNNKTSHYIEFLLTQRTQGSLFSFLKAQGLITDISISHLGDSTYGLLDVYFVLTEKGLDEKDQVISSLFSYIKMLKTVEHSNNIYQELSVLAKREFDYSQPDEPGDWIDTINSDMFIYPLKNVLNHSANYTGLNKLQLTAYLKQLSPNNMQVFLSSSKVTTDKVEPLYNMAYSVASYGEKQLKNWQNPESNSYFYIPKKNPFIGLNELKTYDVNDQKPSMSHRKDGFTLWVKSHNDYQQPKISSVFNIYTDQKNNSEENTLIRMLHSQITHNKMTNFGYYAQLAGFDFNIKNTAIGYKISVTGFNDKSLELINRIFKQFNDLEVTESTYLQAKEALIQNIRHQKNDYPYRQVRSAVYQANMTHIYDNATLIDKLDSLRFTRYQTKVIQINERVQIEGIFTGNLNKKQINIFADNFYKNYKTKLSKGLKELSLQNELSNNIKQPRQLQLIHDDASIAYMVQGNSSNIELQAMFKLINAMMKPEYYKYIRNEKSLGYFVHTHDAQINHTPGFMMVIQSEKYSAQVLKSEIFKFIQSYQKQLDDMHESSFEKAKHNLINRLHKPSNNLSIHAKKLANEMYLGFDKFDRNEQIIKALKLVDKTTFLEFYQKYFNTNTNNPLIIYSLGNSKKKLEQSCLTSKCL